MKTLIQTLLATVALTLYGCFAFSQGKEYLNERYTIIIDVQQYWTDNSLTGEDSASMLKAINTVIENTDPDKIIYIKSEGNSSVLTISFKGVKKETFTGGGLDKNLKVVNNSIFEKTEGDAFTVKQMTDIFEKNNVKNIIITGLLAEECISKTTLGGLSRNYTIYLIPEAIGGKSEKSKAKAINKLRKAGAKIIELSELVPH
jgi:nicotinamidase-related amidase